VIDTRLEYDLELNKNIPLWALALNRGFKVIQTSLITVDSLRINAVKKG